MSTSGLAPGQASALASGTMDSPNNEASVSNGSGSNGRGKVTFSSKGDETFEYKARKHRTADSSSVGTETSSSPSASSSSDERSRHQGRDRRSSGSRGSSSHAHSPRHRGSGGGGSSKERHDRGFHKGQDMHHSYSSNSVAGARGGWELGCLPPGAYPPGQPLLMAQGQPGPCSPGASLQPVPVLPTHSQHLYQQQQQQQAYQPQQQVFQPCHPTPAKAYTAPASAQGPPPTLLVTQPGACPPHPMQPALPSAPLPGYGPCHTQYHPQQVPSSPQAAPSLVPQLQALSLQPQCQHPGPGPALAPPGSPHGAVPAATLIPPPPPLPQQLPPGCLPPGGQLVLPMQPLPYMAQGCGVGGQQQQGGMTAWYDNTTCEVVMADELMVKELAKQSHSLSPLSEAYRSKLAALQAAVNGGLLARREALLQQHARLAARAGEVAAARAALERDISALASDMAARLRSAESMKLALLGREAGEVCVELEALQRLLADVVAASAHGPLELLAAYQGLADSCSRLVSKPLRPEVDVPAGDLPREAAQLSELRQAHEALGQLLGVKDRMIWDLVRERDALKDELQQVVERYSGELQALDRQCQGYYSMLVDMGVGVGPGMGVGTGQGSRGGAEATASPTHPQAHLQRQGTASVGGSPCRDDGA